MPLPPDASFAPNVDIDDSRKWVVKLLGIDETPSRYTDRRKDAMMLTHKFLMYDIDTGIAVEDAATGQLYEQWMFAGDATYDNATTGKIAPAREIANALCGKRLTDDEVKQMIKDGWESSLKGKMAVADLEWTAGPDGTQRLKIIRLRPYQRIEPPSPKAMPDPKTDPIPF